MASPDPADVPQWQQFVAYIGAFGTAVAIVLQAWRGKKSEDEKPSEPKQLVLEHATATDVEPWQRRLDHLIEVVEDLRDVVIARLKDDAERQLKNDIRIQLQNEDANRRIAERMNELDKQKKD